MNDRKVGIIVHPMPIPEENKKDAHFQPYSLSDLAKLPSKEWLIDSVIGVKDLVMIYGPSGSGKTAVAIDMLFAAALGKPWADQFNVNSTNAGLKVAYCGGEGQGGLASRFVMAARKWKIDPKGVNAQSMPKITVYMNVPQLFDYLGINDTRSTNDVEEFAQRHIKYQKNPEQFQPVVLNQQKRERLLDLLVIDTLHTAAIGAQENSAKDVGVVLGSLYQLQDMLGCAIILIHHSARANREQGERGSSALRAAMDTIIKVTGKNTKGKIVCDKSKDAEKFRSVSYQQWKEKPEEKSSGFAIEWTGIVEDSGQRAEKQQKAQILEFLVKHHEVWYTSKQIALELFGDDKKQGTVKGRLNELLEDGRVEMRLKEPSKPKSSRNPYVFRFKSGNDVKKS